MQNSNIHMFQFDGLNIVLDVPSGSVHVVDDVAWAVISLLAANPGWESDMSETDLLARLSDTFTPDLGLEAFAEIKSLKEQGLLFVEDNTREEYRPQQETYIKAMCLHIAHDCNLRCRYCFAASGHFGGNRTLMPLEVGKRAIDFLLEASGPRRHCEIDFFGGEPLMNFDVIKELVEYGAVKAAVAGKVLRFTLTTNGVLLTPEIEEFLNTHEISVVLSLDGREDVNDEMRTFANGQGSYQIVTENLMRFVTSRNHEAYYVRGTYTHNNLDFAADVLHLADLGFQHVSVEPVIAPLTVGYALQHEDIEPLQAEYDKLVRAYAQRQDNGKGFNFFHFNLNLAHGPCLPKRLTGCGAGFDYVAVSPEGELYPCHQFMQRPGFKLGDIYSGLQNTALRDEFKNAHVFNKEKCPTCWARYFCSGGCHANAHVYHSEILKPDPIGCELQKKRLENAIYLQARNCK